MFLTLKYFLHFDKKVQGNLYLKYKLTKFYQNHRRYGYSRIDSQLAGEYVDFSDMDQCKPYRSINDSKEPENWILPCGIFANSVFNDTFTWTNNTKLFSEENITLSVERTDVFKNLSSKYTTGQKWLETNPIFNGQTNEHFIIWMRKSPLPTFSKVYAQCKDCTIEPGDYIIQVDNRYPTDWFKGNKYVLVSKEGALGSQQIFIGIAFLVLGICSLVLAITIFVLNMIFPKAASIFNESIYCK